MNTVETLKWALRHVAENGFGDSVDADSVIEDAAYAYLATQTEQENTP